MYNSYWQRIDTSITATGLIISMCEPQYMIQFFVVNN
jgi:hypothetical protein